MSEPEVFLEVAWDGDQLLMHGVGEMLAAAGEDDSVLDQPIVVGGESVDPWYRPEADSRQPTDA